MDFNPTANRLRFVIGDIRIHAAIHYAFQTHVVRA
jgi:hypothetical protein